MLNILLIQKDIIAKKVKPNFKVLGKKAWKPNMKEVNSRRINCHNSRHNILEIIRIWKRFAGEIDLQACHLLP